MVAWMVWLAVAQSPLAYVGIDQVGRFLLYQGSSMDSSFFPTQAADSVGIVDTFLAADDTTLFGNPGYILFQIRHRSDNATSTDTIPVWEIGNDVMAFYPVADSIYPIVFYRTPFATGQGWSHGFPYATPTQVDADATVETLYVVTDTVVVPEMVSVTVPLGTFNAYHIVRTIQMVVVDPDGGFAPDSYKVNVSWEEWVAPNVGPVRDSLFNQAEVHLFGSWIVAQRSYRIREATDRSVPVAEGGVQPVAVRFRMDGARFVLEGVRPGTAVLVMDALGRRLASRNAAGTLVEGTLPDRKGLYWIRIVAPDGQVRTFRAIRVR